MFEKNLRIVCVMLGLLFCFTLVMWGNLTNKNKTQKTEIEILTKKLDSTQRVSDSLYGELFPTQIELGRYQVAYEIFMERNPKAAKQYGTIISEETE